MKFRVLESLKLFLVDLYIIYIILGYEINHNFLYFFKNLKCKNNYKTI